MRPWTAAVNHPAFEPDGVALMGMGADHHVHGGIERPEDRDDGARELADGVQLAAFVGEDDDRLDAPRPKLPDVAIDGRRGGRGTRARRRSRPHSAAEPR